MKFPFLLLAAAFALSITFASAAGSNPSFESEMETVVQALQTKIDRGSRAEADFQRELNVLDALVAKYPLHAENASEALYLKGMLYMQALANPTKSLEAFEEIKTKYPKTEIGSQIDEVIAAVKRQAAAAKINATLVPGTQFPPFEVTDLNGKQLSIASRKAKVILIDFWATWCAPCVIELPQIAAIYEKYHDKGFDIIGISLDQEKSALTTFLKRKKMPWPQYFDGQIWDNKLAKQYGITGIPATFLVDGDGKILARDLTPESLEKMVSKLLSAD